MKLKSLKKYTGKRPWGEFERFVQNRQCTVKILKIKPNEALSLQFHKKRNEFWRIVKGKAIIVIGNKAVKAKEGDEFFIPCKTNHRIITKQSSVAILEISLGHFDEKDEIRILDKYSRK